MSILLYPFLASGRVNGVGKVAYPGGKCYMYRVALRDKNGGKYTLNNPEQFLSQRALRRRERQRISVDSTDLPVSSRYLAGLRGQGYDVVGMSKWNNTVLVRTKQSGIADKLNALAFVKSITQVFVSPDSISIQGRSNYHKEFSSWSESATSAYGTTANQVKSLNGIKLHGSGYTGKGEMIAVIDGGFMNADKIPALGGAHIAATKDFTVPPSSSVFKEMEHGTMVLSTMAANVPNTYAGTAPDATYVLLRSEDNQGEYPCEEDYWAEAAEFADSIGADVINSSVGYHGFDDKEMNHKYSDLNGEKTLISHTASMIASKGMVLVCSAGNEGMGTWKKINFPADALNIITVGSILPDGTNAPFSAVGPTADGRVKPDVMAYGSPVSVITGRGTIINDMGTSFSAPLVCGMVACLWQALPDKTAFDIIDLVKDACSQVNSPDNIFGYGVPDFWKAYQFGIKN